MEPTALCHSAGWPTVTRQAKRIRRLKLCARGVRSQAATIIQTH